MHRFLRHFLLPHQSNNHRAKALHVDSLLCYVFLFAIFNFGIRIIHREFPNVLGYATDIHAEQMLTEVNNRRIALGLGALQLNSLLSQAAAAKAQDMFADNYWAHNSPQGKTPWNYIVDAGYKYTIAGENLAKNFSTSSGVVDAWMESPTHRDNIVKPGYTDIGFAVVNGVLNGEETTLVVQMFGAGGAGEIAQNIPPKPVVLPKAAVAEQTVVPAPVPEVGSSVLSQKTVPIASLLSDTFSAVIRKPLFNIPTVTRDAAFLFIGLIVGVLAIDGIVVSKKKIIRMAGHNMAHILFFIALFVALTVVRRGVLL